MLSRDVSPQYSQALYLYRTFLHMVIPTLWTASGWKLARECVASLFGRKKDLMRLKIFSGKDFQKPVLAMPGRWSDQFCYL
jgi:hypothetical protein